jgi:hypothetical protein
MAGPRRRQRHRFGEDLLDDFVDGFPDIAPRDIKMLLRLAHRMAPHRQVELDPPVFASSGVFRGLHYIRGRNVPDLYDRGNVRNRPTESLERVETAMTVCGFGMTSPAWG